MNTQFLRLEEDQFSKDEGKICRSQVELEALHQLKTKNIKKRVATKNRLSNGTKRLLDSTRGSNAKAPEAATEQQVDEMERTFSNRWEC